MLHQRTAHSLDTWEEDELMPFNPDVPRKEPGSLISQGMMAALVGYKVSDETFGKYQPDDLRPLSWIPAQLEALEFNTESPLDYESCPRLPALFWLKFEACNMHLPETLSPLFPNIEELELDLTPPDRFEANKSLVQDLAALQKLELLKISATELIDVQLADDCQVVRTGTLLFVCIANLRFQEYKNYTYLTLKVKHMRVRALDLWCVDE